MGAGFDSAGAVAAAVDFLEQAVLAIKMIPKTVKIMFFIKKLNW